MILTSQITSKGQTTIPSKIRELLNLKVHDRIAYEIKENNVLLRPIGGTIFDHIGRVKPSKSPEDFQEIRRKVSKTVSKACAELK